MKTISIENAVIGDGQKVFIIAEGCDNHMGDLEVAKEMCRQAKLAGADCIKFQHHLPDEEMLKDVPMSSNFDIPLYDFLKLHEEYGCNLQIGGDDQWGNMVAGVDLIRRKMGNEREVYALTFPLITRSDGKKMGKTEKGALFLDPELTPIYDFFQYWRNVVDQDVRKFMLLFTFLPVAEIDEICAGDINKAKERLAWEVTAEIHGKEEADKALAGAKAAFGGGDNIDMMPTTEIAKERLDGGIGILDLMVECGMAATKSEVRRLIVQGGCKINGEKITDDKMAVNASHITDKGIILQMGKKKIHRIKV